MARKDNLDFVDQAVESANLQEKSSTQKSKEKKIKTIQILVDWEEKIKAYHGGTISSYITMAIQEKMRRDGIL
ncbi:MAG TPA: hypothetical protein EYH42_10300 [Sulfurovum sp.]|nr:hypothetical protein [Piscirickettsiaceae bacterium]HIQ28866.1 hypothetical protein [Sulfurovum sp.]